MGGRGSSSGGGGGGGGIALTFQGETTNYFFESKNGTNYYREGVGGRPEPTPNNISRSEFIKRAERNGATIKPISAKQQKEMEKRLEEYRKETEKILNSPRNKVGDLEHRAYRAGRAAQRISKRRG